jgi:hypothetical protein
LTLEPLPYHVEVAAELERLESAAWAAFATADAEGRGAPGPEVADAPDGRSPSAASVPLDAAADARAYAALATAAAALGIGERVALHRATGGEGPPNACIVGVPGAPGPKIVFSGDLLGRLSDPWLTAVLGHELGHLALWTADGGRFLVAGRLLQALARDPQSPAAYAETARRFGVATEALADRGAALACGSEAVAAEALRSVRGDAAQVAPGPLDIARLDILERRGLEAATRALIEDALASDVLRTPAAVRHAAAFFPDLSEPPARAPAPRPVPDRAAPETLRYLAYVLLDLATVDPGAGDAGLAAAIALARMVGLAEPFEEVARRELELGERAWDRVARLTADPAGGSA